MTNLRTGRLLLRQWQPEDREPFAAMNSDPEVMRHFPARLTGEQSDALAARAEAGIAQQGWGLWAAEVLDDTRGAGGGGAGGADRGAGSGGGAGASAERFAGFIGLAAPQFEAHFTPAVEVGWRLARSFWGHGYATEGAHAALRFAFDQLDLEEVVSFTTVANDRSRRVMERLAMIRDPADDFDHPRLPGSPIQPHVLYRLRASHFTR